MKEVGTWESKHCALTHPVTEWSTVTADWRKGLVPKDSIQALLYLPWEWSNGSLLLLMLWQQQHTRVIGFSSLLPRPENSAVSSQHHDTCTVLISCQYREHNCWVWTSSSRRTPAQDHFPSCWRVDSVSSEIQKWRTPPFGHLQHHKSRKSSSSEEKKKKIYWKQTQLWPHKFACCQCSAKPSQSRKVRQLIYSWERLAAPWWCQCSTSAILSSSLSSSDRCGTVVAYLQRAILWHCVLLPPLHGATCFNNDTHSPLATPLDF